MIGDAPCHGKNYTGDLDDHFPEGSPEGLTVEDLMREYCKSEIEFSIIKLNDSVDKMIEAMRENHQELEVKDMSDQKMKKIIADHIFQASESGAGSGSVDALYSMAGRYGAGEEEEAEEYTHYGGGGGGGGCEKKMKMKKGFMKEAMDHEFKKFAVAGTKHAVMKYKGAKKMKCAPCEEE